MKKTKLKAINKPRPIPCYRLYVSKYVPPTGFFGKGGEEFHEMEW
jgi:hypothetical protein